MKKEQKQQVSTEHSNVLYTLLGAVSFYDKMPETNKTLTIIHNQTQGEDRKETRWLCFVKIRQRYVPHFWDNDWFE